MASSCAPRIAVAPATSPPWVNVAVQHGGGELVPVVECEGLIWGLGRDAALLEDTLAGAPHCRWVQLPFAGVEYYTHLFDDGRTWTCAKSVFAEPVAELALSLALAGMRNVGAYHRAQSWSDPAGRNLFDANVTIVGGGGITESLVGLLQPFRTRITVVRSRLQEMNGVAEVLSLDQLSDALPGADLVVLAVALTAETDQLISESELGLMECHAWLVNVARGRHIVTDHLVAALQAGTIGGAGLDVTDPEPLPDSHPLWTLDNCIITPHTGTTPDMDEPLMSARIATNVAAFGSGEPLIGLVDAQRGY